MAEYDRCVTALALSSTRGTQFYIQESDTPSPRVAQWRSTVTGEPRMIKALETKLRKEFPGEIVSYRFRRVFPAGIDYRGKRLSDLERISSFGRSGIVRPTRKRAATPLAPFPSPPRYVYRIAGDITGDWRKNDGSSAVNFAAMPYLDAMRGISEISESYGADSARSIVTYFLANAGSWKGDTARQIKAELRYMLAS